MTSRRQFLRHLRNGLLALPLTGCVKKTRTDNRPNIILIMADDIGYSDIGCYGAEISTPNLDRLADNGIRFKQFYNMAKCNPTRSSLFTGHYFGDERSVSFVQTLRDAGYATLWSGKEHFDDWVPHHCYAAETAEKSLTFWATTEYFIPPDGAFERPFYMNGQQVEATSLNAHLKPFYKTDVFTDYALDWLDEAQQTDQPFFLALPYHVAHYPLQARPKDIHKYLGAYRKGWDVIRRERFERMKEMGILEPDCELSPPEDNINKFRGHPSGFEEEREKFPKYRPWDSLTEEEQQEYDLEMAVFAAMIDRMDQNIGRVLKRLEATGELENTLILFFTDNGSCPFDSNVNFDIPPGSAASYRCLRPAWANVGNTPFRFYKQYGHEGGCNTHFIAHWPETISRNQITDQPGHVVDIFPTLLEISGASYPDQINDQNTVPLHGQSLLPVFKGDTRPEPEFFISGFTDRFRMFRQGDWKIVRVNAGDWELYNLEKDRTELNNLATQMPDKLAQMIQSYEKSMAQVTS